MDLVVAGPTETTESELDRKAAELARLQSELAERELELATLSAELQSFELVYLRTIGLRYAELDGVEAEIAALLAAASPRDRAARERAAAAAAQAADSEQAAEWAAGADEKMEPFDASEDLKKLYRRAAKTLHPDLADDEEDRVRRQSFMAEANRAYAQGDEEALRDLLLDWENRAEHVAGDDPEVELRRVCRMIEQARRRLGAIAAELQELGRSDLCRLHRKVERAHRVGVDLLAEMARGLDRQIAAARRRLRALKTGPDPWIEELFAAARRCPAEGTPSEGAPP
ncbi:MAG: J domain-containing protein [Deltaproteobacteria bacterium]|nr:J domain-containing protein [Deltaproteobacteria bacterium]